MLLLETRRKDKQTRRSAVAASDGALIAHKPAVCGRDFPIACLRTASRASTASNRGGNVFFSANASICIHSSQSSICIARKLACNSRCSLGLLCAVSPTGRALRAPLAFACAVFRVFAPPCASLARCSGTAAALWACPRASSRFAAFACGLRFASCPQGSSPSGLRVRTQGIHLVLVRRPHPEV